MSTWINTVLIAVSILGSKTKSLRHPEGQMGVSHRGGVASTVLTHSILLSHEKKKIVYLQFIATKMIIVIKTRPGNIIISKNFVVSGRMTLKICFA